MKKRAFVMVIIAGIFWGTSGIFVNLLGPMGFTSLQLTATRGTVSFLGMALYAVLHDRKIFLLKPKQLLLLLFTGVSFFFSSFLYYTAMRMTNISTSIVLLYTAPIFVVIYSAIFLKEKFSKRKVLSIAVMLLGVVLVSGVMNGMAFSFGGLLAAIGSGVAYASYTILVKYATILKIGSKTSSLYSFLFMGIIGLAFANPAQMAQTIASNPVKSLPLLIGLGVTTLLIPCFLFTRSMKSLSAGTVSTLSIVEPMTGSLIGILLYHDPLTFYSVTGILLILGSVVAIGLESEKE